MKPSPAYAALTAARADGLRFAVLPNGTTIAVRAPRARLEYWAAILQSHKPELLLLLKAGA